MKGITMLYRLAWVLLLCVPMTQAKVSSFVDVEDNIIQQRLRDMNLSISAPYSRKVESYLNTYFVQNRAKAAYIMSYAQYYFPLFDQYLQEYNIPSDLKYLAIVESALHTGAISRSGAVGLWQFMKPTAREMGLVVTPYVDERRDPEKATEAAAKYLSQLHRRFGDWSLALLAYNCGPGRVGRAIRKAGSSKLDKLIKHLPKETQNYLPAFIAASYLVHYHSMHDIVPPAFMDLPTHLGEALVYNQLSFQEISFRTGLEKEEIEWFNPTYFKQWLPASEKGSVLVLPQYHMSLYQASEKIPLRLKSQILVGSEIRPEENFEYFETTNEKIYRVVSGDNLSSIAARNHCTTRNLRNWNNLSSDFLKIGQKLTLVNTERIYVNRVKLPLLAQVPINRKGVRIRSEEAKGYEDKFKHSLMAIGDGNVRSNLIFHILKRGETIYDVSRKYKVSVKELVDLNGFGKDKKPEAGMLITISLA